jgi:hypothetical protein
MVVGPPRSDMEIMSGIHSDPVSISAVVAKQPFNQANLMFAWIFPYNCFHRSVILFVTSSEKFPLCASKIWRVFIPDFFRVMTS